MGCGAAEAPRLTTCTRLTGVAAARGPLSDAPAEHAPASYDAGIPALLHGFGRRRASVAGEAPANRAVTPSGNAVEDMARPRTSHVLSEAARRERAQLADLGGQVREIRTRRRWTQAELARRAATSQATISELERGRGGSMSLATWHRLAVALDVQFLARLSRDPHEQPVDAGHLAIQELVLRLSRASGRRRMVEMPTRPSSWGGSADVCLRDDASATLVLLECWNTIGDIGAAARSFDRKLVDLDALALGMFPDRDHRVCGCWVVRASRRNRELVARYAEVFAARFPASSAGWARGLAEAAEPPTGPGLVWCDVAATRVFAWRRR